jgi:alanyl-tRNA synthetase
MSSLAQIRTTFLEFFKSQGHEIVASSPLVPRNDPTLMFTNSGMVQFKNTFTGVEKRPYVRATTAQKCVRAGGKHNDLDNVGYTARHHTFFEMLGNFSFGDYFKPDAIEWAWTLITKEYGLPKDKLTVTVFHDDDDALNLWKKIAGLPESRIIRIPTSDNFWSMGDTGPCGPCSEIFYDHGDKIAGGPPGSADADGDRFIEIWNLVFMQFEQVSKTERQNLPRPSIDTGMGLERIAAVLQGTHDNYETDLFKALISAVVERTGVSANGKFKASNRVIADHLRASSFLIADGVLPSNEGRGYVLRRIMRRAMRHAELLGMKQPLMHKLVPTLVREMGTAYPELVRAEALIAETLQLEEVRFRKTLERGLRLLDEESESLSKGDVFKGETAFKLYDTYGFPLDLTQDALKSRGVTVDTDAFNAAMGKQKEDARRAWKGSGDAKTETIWFDLREKHGATEFLGYDTETAEGLVLALVQEGKTVDAVKAGEKATLVVNQTPFYAESGGQTGDHGVIKTADGSVFRVTDTLKRVGDLFVHLGEVESGQFKAGDAVALTVDTSRRSGNRQHHSATHLLHEALRTRLGTHVAQKGSMVEPGRLRFDFSHTKPMTADDVAFVEAMANDIVLQNDAVNTRLMTVDDAVAEGAMALFGEKYGDEVRVVSMGRNPEGSSKPIYSLELCGGTHVRRTGDIGLIKVVSESAVAAGVRRMEALAGSAARAYLDEQDKRVSALADALKTSPAQLVERVQSLMDERKSLEKELRDVKKAMALASSKPTLDSVGAIAFSSRIIQDLDAQDLKPLVLQDLKTLGSGVSVNVSVSAAGAASIVVGVSADLTSKFDAVALVRVAASAVGGKGGGGKSDLAQAGGPDGAKAQQAIAAVKSALA